MGSNVNPADIEDFLRGIRSSAYHAHGRPEYDFSDSRDNEPRWAPSVPTSAANLLGRNDDNDDDDGEAYFNDDAHSEYTAVSTVTSHPYTVRSAAPPSIFSHQDDDDDDVRSIAQSMAPSLVGPYTGPTFVQQFFGAHTADFDPAPTQPGQALWCEFSTLLNCPALFRLDDEAGWIEHHEAHLGDPLPRKLMCWFCDDGHAPFEAARPRETRTNFVARMQHVREHILGDPYPWTSEHTRPDFYVVRHLWKSGLLSREVYEHAMTYDELPEVYRLPGWREHSHHHAQAPSSHRALDEARKERGQVHDLEKEKRAERRRLKEKLHHGSGGGGGGSSSSSRKRR